MSGSKPTVPTATLHYPVEQWERLWFALSDRSWRSLALVAAQPGISTIVAANALFDSASRYQRSDVIVVDASGTQPEEVGNVQDTIANELWAGHRVLVALGHPLDHSPSIPLARFTDAALLCVQLKHARIDRARLTVQCIGEPRFIGSMTMGF